MQISKPIRATRTYTQRLIAGPDAVFPLLCPVREAEWIDGWDPARVVSTSGVAEADCVFTTAAGPLDAVWYITRHERATGFVEMLKITPLVHGLPTDDPVAGHRDRERRRDQLHAHQSGTIGGRVCRRIQRGLLSSVHAGLGIAAQSLSRPRHRPESRRGLEPGLEWGCTMPGTARDHQTVLD